MKKYYVNPLLAVCVIILGILEFIPLIVCLSLSNFYEWDWFVKVVLFFFSCILPVIQIIGIVCLMLAKVEINEKGVAKYLFGKKIKSFSWESIKEVKGLDKDAYWLVVCNKLVDDEDLIFNNRKSYTIPICKREEVVKEIEKYYRKKQNNFDELFKRLLNERIKILIKENSKKLSIEADKESLKLFADYLANYADNEADINQERLQFFQYYDIQKEEQNLSEIKTHNNSEEHMIKEIEIMVD